MQRLDSANSDAFSRRQWLQAIGCSLFDALAGSAAGEEQAPEAMLPPLNRFPRMVQEYFVERVRAAEQAGLKVRAGLKTRADAEAYIQSVRKSIQLCFGPFPEKRAPGKLGEHDYAVPWSCAPRPIFPPTAGSVIGQQDSVGLEVGHTGKHDMALLTRRLSVSPSQLQPR